MANIYVSSNGTPRVARNKKIYAGNSFVSQNGYGAATPQRHFEAGKITDLTDRAVTIYFASEFAFSPILVNLKVFRMVENIPTAGKWIKQDVLHYFDDDDWYVKTGFSLFIDDSEDLTGVIIEYCFTE